MLECIFETLSVLLSGKVKLLSRSFPSEGNGGGVTEKIDVKVEILSFEGGAVEKVLKDIEVEVGIILEVFLRIRVVPAGISAIIDVSNGLGKRVDGEGLSTFEDEVVE